MGNSSGIHSVPKGSIEISYSHVANEDTEQDENNGATNQTKILSTEYTYFLLPYFWPDDSTVNKLRCLSTGIMVSLSKTFNVAAPLYLSRATNALVTGKYEAANSTIMIYVCLKFMSTFFKELQTLVYLPVKQAANIRISVQSFRHIHQQSHHWHINKQMGAILRTLDRGAVAADNLVSFLVLTLVPGLLECGAVCVLFVLRFERYELSLVVFCGIMFYVLVTRIVTLKRKQFRQTTNKQDNICSQLATDTISNFETVKNFTAEEYEAERYQGVIAAYQKSRRMIDMATGTVKISQQFIVNAALLANLLLASQQLARGDMNVGDFVAINAYTINVFAPLNTLGGVYNGIVQAVTDLNLLLDLLRVEPDVQDREGAQPIPIVHSLHGPPPPPSVLEQRERTDPILARLCDRGTSVEFEDVSFRYPSQSPDKGLCHVSFFVAPGTTTAIVGSSGSGKTTISRLIFRFYNPCRGCVKLGGYDISEYTQASVRACVGIVPQDTSLFNDTLLHNIRYGRRSATLEEVEAAAEAAQIKEFIEALPDKWNTQVGERGLRLSGGEKQLKNPPIVILDEATSALDSVTERSVQDALGRLSLHRTVIIVAHRLSTIMHADNIIVINAGRVVEQGSHRELLDRGGQYQCLWESQYREQQQEQALDD